MEASSSQTPALVLSLVLDCHTELEDVFAFHQQSLMVLDLRRAAALLDYHWELLSLHMRQEEELLLPCFDRAPKAKRWPRVLFTGQHQKLRELHERCRAAVRVLPTRANQRNAVLRVLQEQATYLHLEEHHDQAEREGFFPLVELGATPGEAQRLLEQCRREWHSLTAANMALMDSSRETLDGWERERRALFANQ